MARRISYKLFQTNRYGLVHSLTPLGGVPEVKYHGPVCPQEVDEADVREEDHRNQR